MKSVKKILAMCLAIMMIVSCVPAAHAADVSNTAIDLDAKGSLTLYKYDLTNAEKDGVWDSSYVSTGVYDENVNKTLGESKRAGDSDNSSDLGNGEVSYGYAVKGVEFGRGFGVARLSGTQNNDPYEVRGGTCVPATNNAGGILGGITTGAPVLVRCAFKPISSVMVEQDSVDLTTMEPARLKVHGRHDTTAVIRAVPVVEAVCALALADVLLAWPAE